MRERTRKQIISPPHIPPATIRHQQPAKPLPHHASAISGEIIQPPPPPASGLTAAEVLELKRALDRAYAAETLTRHPPAAGPRRGGGLGWCVGACLIIAALAMLAMAVLFGIALIVDAATFDSITRTIYW